MTNKDIDKTIDELRKLEKKAAKLKSQIDTMKDDLKKELDDRQVDSVDTGAHKVFQTCYEKRGVDTQKLKDAGLFDEYSKTSVVTRFTINDVAVLQRKENRYYVN